MGEYYSSSEIDYRKEYYDALSELHELRGIQQRYRALYWAHLLACYVGGCLMVLSVDNDFSSLQEFLTLYALAAGMGLVMGFFILLFSGAFEIIAGYETKATSVRRLFLLACLIAPLVYMFALNLPPEP